MDRPVCPRCESAKPYKYGFGGRGQQRWKCRQCNYQFTCDHKEKGAGVEEKLEMVKLYCSGVSFRRAGRIKGKSHTTARRWVTDFAEKHLPEKPEIDSPVTAVQMDEQWHFLQKNEQALAVEGCRSSDRPITRLGDWETKCESSSPFI